MKPKPKQYLIVDHNNEDVDLVNGEASLQRHLKRLIEVDEYQADDITDGIDVFEVTRKLKVRVRILKAVDIVID